MLGSLERSGLQIHLVFDADVYFLMMVVVILLGMSVFKCSWTS